MFLLKITYMALTITIPVPNLEVCQTLGNTVRIEPKDQVHVMCIRDTTKDVQT
jgi:hypothetical protein